VRSKPQGRPTATGFSANHEYAVFWGSPDALIGRLPRSGSKAERYPYSDEKGIYAWSNFRKSGTDSNRSDRPKSFYPVYVAGDGVRIPRMTWSDADESWVVEDEPSREEVVVWPIDSDKNEKVWTCSPARAASEIDDIRVQCDTEDRIELQKKYRPNQEGALPGTWWDDSKYSSSESGTKVLKDLFGASEFDYPKSVNLVSDSIRVCGATGSDSVLDYFAGSGTTAHSIINLNREDGHNRKYILVEMGHYFDTVMKPRIQKVIYSSDWKDGKPVSREGSSHLFKYIRLESYEDSLNNLQVTRTVDQSSLLEANKEFRQDYILRYMLESETCGSASVLTVNSFVDPFNYQLKIATESVGESRYVNVDLVETFNYLLGLQVKHVDFINGFQIVEGTNPDREKVLVIWRNTQERSNSDLDTFFQKQAYKTGDNEFDLIYVNGDNNLENLRREDETWKVRLIEQEFHRLMFDVRDV
jgi:adenine-specific DNA-methyltransferase